MTDTRSRHAGEHECDGSVGRAIYDPGTPCDAIREADEKDRIREQGNALILAAEARADAAEAALALMRIRANGMEAARDADRAAMRDKMLMTVDELSRSVEYERAKVADMKAQRDAARAELRAHMEAEHGDV